MDKKLNIKFLISDWDGTLVDSMSSLTKSFAKTMSDYFHIPESSLITYSLSTAGQALSHQIKEAAQKFAHKEVENTLEIEDKFWENMREIKPKILKGANNFLKEIKNKGIKIIVWSGTRTDILRKGIENLGLSPLIDFAIGNEPGSNIRVKGPGLFSRIAKHFRMDKKDLAAKSLVIGDGNGDIQAGKNIGAKTAGFIRIPNVSLETANPDFFFNNYSELLQKLDAEINSA